MFVDFNEDVKKLEINKIGNWKSLNKNKEHFS